MSKGTKFDNNKSQHDLIPYEALDEIAKVLAVGAERYGRFNWKKGIDYSRLISATYRHLGKFNNGEDINVEDGNTLHLANAACNLLFLIWMTKHRKDLDDRYHVETEGKIGSGVPTSTTQKTGSSELQTQTGIGSCTQAALQTEQLIVGINRDFERAAFGYNIQDIQRSHPIQQY